MTNEQKARKITEQIGGDYNECLDWLDDGDGDIMELDELLSEWLAVGRTYTT